MKKILLTLISFLALISFISVNAEELSATAEINLDENVQASDLGVAEPNLLPGHPFYFIKNWTRNVRSIMTFDPVKKANLEAEFANEKLIELKRMTELNMSENSLNDAIQEYQERVRKTEELTVKIEGKAGENEEVKNFSEQFAQQQILHQKILQKLEEQVPEGVFEKIKEAREEHLDKFQNVLSNIENTEDIPDRLVGALDKISGSDFREIKDVEILSQLKEKLPEQLVEKMEEKIEERTEALKERLENLPAEEQEKFQEYIKNIQGDERVYLNVIDSIKGRILSDDLEKIINTARDKTLEKIKEEGINLDSSQLQEEFINNEKFLEQVKTLILEKNLDKNTIPEVFQLAEDAEINLDKAKEYLEDGNYSEAFKEMTSSLSLSQNTEGLIRRISGFNLGTDDEKTIMCDSSIDFPVCGVNGKTYQNICEATKENMKVVYRGECQEQERECATINEQVNRNPLLGPTDQKCCEGLEEFRISKSYSICRKSDDEFECVADEDCPLSRCVGEQSRCVDNKCIIPRCEVSCIQVITPAIGPDGEYKEFSTPCDIPAGWVRTNMQDSKATQLKDSVKQEEIEVKNQIRTEAIKQLMEGDSTTNQYSQ